MQQDPFPYLEVTSTTTETNILVEGTPFCFGFCWCHTLAFLQIISTVIPSARGVLSTLAWKGRVVGMKAVVVCGPLRIADEGSKAVRRVGWWDRDVEIAW